MIDRLCSIIYDFAGKERYTLHTVGLDVFAGSYAGDHMMMGERKLRGRQVCRGCYENRRHKLARQQEHGRALATGADKGHGAWVVNPERL